MRFILCLLLAVSSEAAEKRIWSNFSDWPTVVNSVDYFPLIRRVDASGQTLSAPLGIEDVHLTHHTRITRIMFLSLDTGVCQVTHGDWFVLDGYQYTWAFQVIHSGIDQPLQRIPLNVFHNGGGQVMLNVFYPQNLVLPPGSYYFGFRTVQSDADSMLGGTWPLAYNGIKGWTSAGFTADVDVLGNINSPITYLDNTVYPYDLEWAMGVFGESL